MSFGGSVSAMITSMKNNSALRKNHRKSWQDVGQSYHYNLREKEKSEKPKMSAEELAAFKTKLQHEARQRNLKIVVTISLLALLIFGGGYFFLFHM